MSKWTLITVTKTLVGRYGGELRCKGCGRRLEVGELAWSHYEPSRRSSKTSHYCKGCYKRLRIWGGDEG